MTIVKHTSKITKLNFLQSSVCPEQLLFLFIDSQIARGIGTEKQHIMRTSHRCSHNRFLLGILIREIHIPAISNVDITFSDGTKIQFLSFIEVSSLLALEHKSGTL